MEVLRYTSNAWGQKVLEGISWELLPVFIGVGAVVIACHACYKWLQSSKTD